MLKVGIIGKGNLVALHIETMAYMKQVEIVGFVDTDNPLKVQCIADEYHFKKYDCIEKLIDDSDVLDILTPLTTHYNIAMQVIRKGKHFFISYPICQKVEEAKLLVQLIKEANVKCQIGSVSRYNPAYKQVEKYFDNVSFVDINHVLSLNEKNFQLDLLFDILYQDIDILLHTIKNPLKNIYAHGTNLLTDSFDIINVCFEFNNGCAATIRANRVAEQEIHKATFFQSDSCINVDFLKNQSDIIHFKKNEIDKNIKSTLPIKDKIIFQSYSNAIHDELESFLNAIIYNKRTLVNEFDGLNVLEIIEEIVQQITFKKQHAKI